MSADESPISTKGLVKRYTGESPIGPFDLKVESKWIFGFLGPNGAGKTTTIRMLLGLSRPTQGTVRIFGRDPKADPRALQKVGYAPELPNLQTFFTAEDLLDFTAKLYGIGLLERKRVVRNLLEIVGLSDHAKKKIGKYSKGMVQRLSIAQAMVNDPDLLIMDEPTIGLDPAATIHFRDLFRSLVSQGRTIFISSHQLHEVEKLATHIGMISRGKMLFQGPTEKILDGLADGYRVEVELERIDEQIVMMLRQLPYVSEVRVDTEKIFVTLKGQKDLRADLVEEIIKSGGRLRSLSLSRATLEEAFVETLRRGS